MKSKLLYMDWMAKFQCIGSKCPMTCCSSCWEIKVTDKEIARFENMEHPFGKEIINAIDQEKKCMRHREGYCPLLTEDGLCRIVLECGEEYLSHTCTVFPRSYHLYGDIVETTVEILCPVAARYLLEKEEIGFCLAEKETELPEKEIDYQVYDSLSLARTYLVDLVQAYPCRFVSGKLYILFDVIGKISELCDRRELDRERVQTLLHNYDGQEIRRNIFIYGEKAAGAYGEKSIILQKLLAYIQPLMDPSFVFSPMADSRIRKNLQLWMSDREALTKTLEEFGPYVKEEYPALADNYMVYILFQDFISMDLDSFGHVMAARIVELALIQLCVMSLWKQKGKVEKETYGTVIAAVDRLFGHNKVKSTAALELLYKFIQEQGGDYIETLLLLLI